jgi:hypothetical protein
MSGGSTAGIEPCLALPQPFTCREKLATRRARKVLWGRQSRVPRRLLNELNAGAKAEFGVNMGEVGLHGPW